MTTHTKKLFATPPRVALISIRPCHVDKILSGEKRLEFRRKWAAEPVDMLVIYSTSPTKRLVATANIVKVTEASPTALWELAKAKKGGVSRQLIYDYFSGVAYGYAIEISNVREFAVPIDPQKVFQNFIAPQSFRYLEVGEYSKIVGRLGGGEK